MGSFSRETTVAEIAARHPSLLRVLTGSGLHRAGEPEDQTLDQLCAAFGLHPAIIIRMLETAEARIPPPPPPVDLAQWADCPLGELVDHIETTHHAWLRRELPPLVELAGNLSAAHPESERRRELYETLAGMADELVVHLQHEEESVFPIIRDLHAGTEVRPTRCGSAIGGPIACMENEHERTVVALNRRRELAGGYAAGSSSAEADRELLQGLTRVEQDLLAHMYKENELLFPRALATGQNVRAGRPSTGD